MIYIFSFSYFSNKRLKSRRLAKSKSKSKSCKSLISCNSPVKKGEIKDLDYWPLADLME